MANQSTTQGKGKIIGIAVVAIIVIFIMSLVGTYNGLVQSKEEISGKINDLQAQYQRRTDLIPNLVSTVKGSAEFEKSTLEDVMNARAKATSIQLNADNLTEEDLKKFQDAQNEVTSSLNRLMAVAESYPELKTTAAFQDLMTQLEVTENRISVARQDYGSAVKTYNTKVKSFPTNILAGMFGFSESPYFEAESTETPKVQFDF